MMATSNELSYMMVASNELSYMMAASNEQVMIVQESINSCLLDQCHHRLYTDNYLKYKLYQLYR